MGFRLLPGDLIRLVETPHERQAEELARLGGVEGVAQLLDVDVRQGLDAHDTADLDKREAFFGKNYVPPPRPQSLLELMWNAAHDITIVALAIAGTVSIVLTATVGDHKDTGWIEGACIIVTVFICILVAALNDYQKEKQFRALNAVKDDETIKVIRNGVPSEVSKFNLLVGDIVRVDLGDIIPADGIVLDAKELKLDESAMTGETDLLPKNTQHPFLLSGTKVMEGLGKMLVVAVGENSQAGIIKKLINGKRDKAKKKEPTTPDVVGDGDVYVEVQTPKPHMKPDHDARDGGIEDESNEMQSPLEGKLYRLTILISKFGIVMALIVFLGMSIRFSYTQFVTKDKPWSSDMISRYLDFLIVAITVLAVAIPEGLPLAVTIALAYSVKKMLTDNNLVRHLDACETMGSATTVCSDKTGTLTTNRMTVMQLWIGDSEFASAQSAATALSAYTKQVFLDGVCVNSTAEILPPKVDGGQPEHTGNKTESALLQFARDCGVEYAAVRELTPVAHMLTFSSAKKRMSVVVPTSANSCRVYTKGATEVVLELCTRVQHVDGSSSELHGPRRTAIGANVIEKYASQGYRTLCLAYRDLALPAEQIKDWTDEQLECELTCVAIVGIEDPVRPEVPGAIKDCERSGITVRMVTGDNITTARSIAKKCGIITPGDGALVMEGAEFRARVLDASGNLVQSEFDKIWPMLRVLARSSPKDKYTLVSGLMQSNLPTHGPQVVAVTGDGTNDAPALKKANVGFAMGICGTSVAKDASDIILMDDNFSSIVNAIKWGRNVYDSIAKFLQFQLTVNVVAITLAVLGAIIMEQSPLTAIQLLWMNLIMDSFASLALATDEPTQAMLDRKPYPKTKPLISKKMTKHILGQSVLQLAVLIPLVWCGDKWFNVPTGRMIELSDEEQKKKDPTVHMTIVFNTFVWFTLFNEINARKIHDEVNVFAGITKNRIFGYVCAFQIVMQVVLVQWSGRIFNCAPLTATQWFICIALGALSLPWGLALRVISSKHLPNWMVFGRDGADDEVRQVLSGRGQELWLRGFALVRAQFRVVRAFKKALEARRMLTGESAQ